MSSHTAGGPLAGYIWQLRRALIALLDADFGDKIQVEVTDDIAVARHGIVVSASQAKHSLMRGNVTTKSVELWKTLRVWISLSASGKTNSQTKLIFCSTLGLSKPLANLAAQKPRANLEAALTTVATQAANSELLDCYKSWLGLHQPKRLDLLHQIEFESASPNLAASTASINNALKRMGFPVESLDRFTNKIIGWFETTITANLTAKGCTIAYEALNEQLQDLHNELIPRALTALFSNSPAPELSKEREGDPTYLRQLDLLGAEDQELAFAVSMFHRATKERNSWLQGRITGIDALHALDSDLETTWGQKRSQLERLTNSLSEQERGWQLLDHCVNYRTQLNGAQTPAHVAIGSYHILANDPEHEPKVGWHPDYVKMLAKKGAK